MQTTASRRPAPTPRSNNQQPACPTCCGLGERLAVTLSDEIVGTTHDWQYGTDGTCATCDGTGVYACAACGAAPADYAAQLSPDGYLCTGCQQLYDEGRERDEREAIEHGPHDEPDYTRR